MKLCAPRPLPAVQCVGLGGLWTVPPAIREARKLAVRAQKVGR